MIQSILLYQTDKNMCQLQLQTGLKYIYLITRILPQVKVPIMVK